MENGNAGKHADALPGSADMSKGKRGIERLSDKSVGAWLKREGKAGQKLADGGGLYLTRLPSGRGAWQVRYSYGGKVCTFSIGTYPEVGLSAARAERRRVKLEAKNGTNPISERRALRIERTAASGSTFGDLTHDWLQSQKPEWSDVHFAKSKRALERDVLPALGTLPVARITPAAISAVINRIQGRGVRDTTQKILQHVRSIFSRAQALGLRTDNPAGPVSEIVKRADSASHHPALLTFPELGDVLRRAERSNITPAVRLCHKLIGHTMVRVSNAVAARWAHFDLQSKPAIWTIPRNEMKVRGKGRSHPHRIVLTEQISNELRRWRTLQSDNDKFLFPGQQGRPHLSREAVEKALRETMALAGKHSPHGWRSAFSTLAREETDFDGELIDLALDHVHASKTALAYDRGERLAKRVALMTWWGESLERAERGAEVLRLDRGSRTPARDRLGTASRAAR